MVGRASGGVSRWSQERAAYGLLGLRGLAVFVGDASPSIRFTARAGPPNQDERIATATSAPTAGECVRPRTVTRLTSRQNSGSTKGKETTPGRVTRCRGMKA